MQHHARETAYRIAFSFTSATHGGTHRYYTSPRRTASGNISPYRRITFITHLGSWFAAHRTAAAHGTDAKRARTCARGFSMTLQNAKHPHLTAGLRRLRWAAPALRGTTATLHSEHAALHRAIRATANRPGLRRAPAAQNTTAAPGTYHTRAPTAALRRRLAAADSAPHSPLMTYSRTSPRR